MATQTEIAVHGGTAAPARLEFCDRPNQFARQPGLEKTGATIQVHGYQEFSISPDAIAPLPTDGPLLQKQNLVRGFFTPEFIRGKTVLDLGANGGFFSFWAQRCGAGSVTAVDLDVEYIRIVQAVTILLGLDRIETRKMLVQDCSEEADMVVAFAMVHWLYSCTAAYGSLDSVLGKLRALARQLLIVEWVAPNDPAMAVLQHTSWNSSIIQAPYNQDAFEDALRRHFARVEIYGYTTPTRTLYIAWTQPDEIDLNPELPLLAPRKSVLSSRLLATCNGQKYFSRVYLGDDGLTVLKQASYDLAVREMEVLGRLQGERFPRVLSSEQREGYSIVLLERIQGSSLNEMLPSIATTPASLARFFHDCLEVLADLQKAGVLHRDVRAGNILVRNGRPVLIDFGWALLDERSYLTPDGLGDTGRPMDGSFCDVYSMGQVLASVCPKNTSVFGPLIHAMTAQHRAQRLVQVGELQAVLRSLELPQTWEEPPRFGFVTRNLVPLPSAQHGMPSDTASVLPLRSEFDESRYLRDYPDVAAAVHSKEIASGWDHFERYGFSEGRRWFRKATPAAEPQFMNSELPNSKASTSKANAEIVELTALTAAAESYFQHGELAAAIETLEHALRLKANDFDCLMCLGNIQYRAKDMPGAVASFRSAMRQRTDSVIAHLSLATALIEMNDFLESEGAIRLALAIEPSNVSGLKLLTRLQLNSQRYKDAASVCEAILKNHGRDTDTWLALGRCRYELGDWQGAGKAFEQVLSLDPSNQIAAENLAHLRATQGHRENEAGTGPDTIGAAGDTRFARFRFHSPMKSCQTYQQIKQLKIGLIAGFGAANSSRDFGGLWGVYGLYLLQGAKALRCGYAEMVDVTPRPEFQEKIAELHRTMPLEVKMTQGDFRDPRLLYPLQPVEVSLLYEVLLHQDNAVEVIKNVVSKTTRCICVAQPVMKEELFALPNGAVNLQFYPEELKDQLRYSGWWEKEPVAERFTTGYWMWGQTTSHLTSIFHGYGWVPTFLETYEASEFWNYLLVRFEPRQGA